MRNWSKNIVIAGATLLLAGSLALAGDDQGVSQSDDGHQGGGSRGLLVSDAGDNGFIDVDRKYPFGGPDNRTDICGSMGEDEKCSPRPLDERDETKVYARAIGVCLPFTIRGRRFCWG